MPIPVWSARHLVISWLVYWGALLAVAAGRPLWRYWQLQRADAHGTVSLSYSGSALTLALWIAGPPLLLFVAWLATRPRARAGRPASGRPAA